MNLCVYLGSNFGNHPSYREAAHDVGLSCAKRGWTIVYGGSNKGLMGEMADAALANGGRVLGVIPDLLQELGAAKSGLSELYVVNDMHERKAKMASLSDAFLALPGGVGTWEEVLEASAWNQLGIHHKNVGILNLEGYYDSLRAQMDRAVRDGFLMPAMRESTLFGTDVETMLDLLSRSGPALPGSKWFNN
jgi:hypothetical protein